MFRSTEPAPAGSVVGGRHLRKPRDPAPSLFVPAQPLRCCLNTPRQTRSSWDRADPGETHAAGKCAGCN